MFPHSKAIQLTNLSIGTI